MRTALAVAALLLLASAVVTERAAADAMRCGTHLVTDTATLAQTLKECGAPTTRDTHVEHVQSGHANKNGSVAIYSQDIVVDILHYDFGPHEFVYRLIFNDGAMVNMAQVGRGKPR